MKDTSFGRILVVDDEDSLVKALTASLRERGYHVAAFNRAGPALAALRQGRFDVLLADIVMPEMDGITLLKGAKAVDPDIVAIMMTGEGSVSTAVEAMKCGAFDFILKPFRLSYFLPILARALALRRLVDENGVLRRRVEERTRELELARQELDAFNYSVIHDLRAPLRHISGAVRSLSEDAPAIGSPREQQKLRQIAQRTETMSRMIEDMLDYARVGRSEMRPVRLDANQLMDEVLADLAPETRSRKIVWKKGRLPEVLADPALLRRVFGHLVSNAVKYSRSRNPAVIEFGSLANATAEEVLFVRDNGVGFDMAVAHKLFVLFKRLHGPEEFEGGGAGLALVRRIIERHGGRTWAESKPEAGATFYFSLPRQAPRADDASPNSDGVPLADEAVTAA